VKAAKFLGLRLKELRAAAGLTQEQAASAVGLTFKYYQRAESGVIEGVRLITLEQIALAYGISLSELFAANIPAIRPVHPKLPPPHRKARRTA
jgi:transcriptional regulator with XRE-family HTH domain